MQKYKAKREVVEQVTSKLNNAKNREIKGNLGEISSIFEDSSKLQASKNVFARGDFDEYKISDEELLECQFIQKSNILPIGHITEHPDGSLSQKIAQGQWIYLSYNIKDLSDKQTGDDELDRQRGRKILERMNLAMQATPIKNINPIYVPNGNETYLANFLKPYLDKIENEIKSGNLRCKANGKSVVQFLRTHTYKNKKGVRSGDDLQNHAGYLPFVIPLIKKYGITDTSMNRPAKNNATFIELIGRADIINPVTNKKERVGISVVLVTLGNKTSMLKDISVFKIFDKYSLIKSIQHNSLDVSIASLDMDRIDLLNHQTVRIIPNSQDMSSKNIAKSTISDKLFRLWQRRLSPELQKEMEKYVDEHSRVYSLFSSYKDVYDIKGYPKGLDLENNILLELGDTYFVVSCGGDWQDEKLVKFSIGEDDKLKAEVVDKCDKEDKRVLNKKLAYIINPETINKSLFTNWKVELHNLCDQKGLDYNSVIQKYDTKIIRFIAEEQLHQDAETVIAYKAYKDLNKSLTYSGHKLQGRTKLYGMDISIENKKGSYRSGVDSDGHKWKCFMNYDYGYIRGTVGTDGDHLDVYVGPAKDSNKVYVIHQNNPVTHKYDEDKCMLCFESADAAKKGYMKQYDRPGFFGSMDILTVDEFKSYVFSHLGKRIHKSFDITVTDITENNKQQKINQLEKSLLALYENKPFVIKHIDADNSKNYGNLTLRITDFDRNKIQKAVHSMALSLDGELKSGIGEAFVYKSQEELTDNFVKEITEKTKDVYSFLIGFFGLPEMRVVTKSDVTYNGKVIYDPETGKPMTKADWDKFVKALENVLSKSYKGYGKKIVLNSVTLGKLLAKMSETHTLENVRKMKLKELNYGNRKFEWISQTAQNMESVFGEQLSRERQARIQVAIDSAAMRITKIEDNMRNDIQQIIIDGIKNKESKSKISQQLFNSCVGFNRDIQRIADTEIQNNSNNAYVMDQVYHTKEGEKVYFRRFEQIDNITCKKCKKANEKIVLWSDTPLMNEKIVDSYADYAIWEGKIDGEYPMSNFHPWCYSDDTEVMTNNGWKLFKDVLDSDLIMSINPDNYEVDFVPFVNRTSYFYEGDMINFPGRNFDLLVTPNHNMLITDANKLKVKQEKAENLLDIDFNIPRAIGKWIGHNPDKIRIGSVYYSYNQYVKLWAWYLAEGSGRRKGEHAYEIKLAQKDINKILNDIPEFKDRFVHGEEALYCTGKIAEEFFEMFGVYADKKYIPSFIKNSSAECIRDFLISYNLGDGSKRNRTNINNKLGIKSSQEMVLRTSSKQMADDLCELIVKAGWMPSVSVNKQKGELHHFKNGDYVLKTDCYIINVCKSKYKTYSHYEIKNHPPRKNPYKQQYKGMVYDVELEKWHFLLVKRNGKCSWSGNCRGCWVRYRPEGQKWFDLSQKLIEEAEKKGK